MKTLLIISASAIALLTVGCESSDTSKPMQPANQTASSNPAAAPTTYQMTPSQKRVYELQSLDDNYINGESGMTPAEYQMRQKEIIGQY